MLRVGIAGAGWVAEEFHGPAYDADPRATIVAIADLDSERAEGLAERYDARAHSTASEMIRTEDLDVVSVCTPPHTHEEVFAVAVEGDCAVFCEKPMTTSLESARRMADLADEHGAVTQVGYVQKFYANYRKARTIAESGLLGDVTHVKSIFYASSPPREWYLDPDAAGGGVVADRLPHLLDFYLDLFDGPFQVVDAEFRSVAHRDVEDVADVDLVAGDVRLDLSVGWTQPDTFSAQVVLGTHGRLAFDNVRLSGSVHGEDFHFKYGRSPRVEVRDAQLFLARPDDAQSARITSFLDHVERGDRDTAAPVDRGVEIAKTIDAIYDTGRSP